MRFPAFDLHAVPSPSFVVDLELLRRNLSVMRDVQARSGAHILLAMKGFAMWPVFPIIAEYLHGTCSSSPYEAQLAKDYFDGKDDIHAYAPAYSEREINQLLPLATHLSFNSFNQWHRWKGHLAGSRISPGLRVNPEYSEVEVALYNPCAPRSRLGTRIADFAGQDLAGLEGLHFHTLCEQNSDTLERTLAAFEGKFAKFLPQMKWVNFGGGHHISRADYDVERLVRILKDFKARYPHLEVYLEPGEAVALNTGYLVVTVMDIIENEGQVAILDTSATAHMPDVLEMPYRPVILGAGFPDEFPYTYRLGGMTCLAGDVIGDWSFPAPLEPGQKLVFTDMAHYTMVKTTMFNGVQHPAIVTWDPASEELKVVREFGYEDFRDRLG
jgi:carboxynorspermidine decarboxylase